MHCTCSRRSPCALRGGTQTSNARRFVVACRLSLLTTRRPSPVVDHNVIMRPSEPRATSTTATTTRNHNHWYVHTRPHLSAYTTLNAVNRTADSVLRSRCCAVLFCSVPCMQSVDLIDPIHPAGRRVRFPPSTSSLPSSTASVYLSHHGLQRRRITTTQLPTHRHPAIDGMNE